MENNDVLYDLGEIGTTPLLYEDPYDYHDEASTSMPSVENTTDAYNRTSPIYSITPDFLSKW